VATENVPAISIVIPAYNAGRTIAACLDACAALQPPPFECIVVDDGSSDDTVDIATRHGARVLRQENAGPATARNFGAAHAKGDWIAFTDADCVPASDWLLALARAMRPAAAAVGGTYGIVNTRSRLARIVHAEILARHARLAEEVDFLGSFNLAVRAAAFRDIGGFDTMFSAASGEDNDLAYRLQDAGGRLRFTRAAIVAHHHPEHLWPYLQTQARHGYWRMRLYRKHPHRARAGDDYAPLAEMLSIPYALMLSLALPVLMLAGVVSGQPLTAGVLMLLLLLAQLVLHIPLALRVAAHASASDFLFFPVVAMLRDYARGAGLLLGLWRFRQHSARPQ